MSISKITADLNNISVLKQNPNIEDDLTEQELKEKFDKAGNDIKTAVNLIVDELESTTDGSSGASQIGASAIYVGDASGSNVQAKLEELQSETDDLKAGGLTDGSIATAKLADGAVTSDKLDTDAKKAANLTATSIGTGDSYDGNIQAKLVGLKSEVDTKVDKVEGKALSTNDYDNTEKSSVASNTSARHTHDNKTLLDTYTQTEANLSDAVSTKHSHSNATILDNTTASYTTTEATKLSGIDENANNYSLPTASTSTLGGVKIDGVTVLIDNGVISSVGGGSGADLIDRYNTPTLTQETIGEETVNILSLANELDAYFNKQRVLIDIPSSFDNTKTTYLNINSLGNKLINGTMVASGKYELIYNNTDFDIKPIMWVGTQEEYDAITTKNIYLIYGINSGLIGNSIDKIYYGQIKDNSVFICVGASGVLYYSTNGTSWTAMTGLNTSYAYKGVAYGDDRFICVGIEGKSYYSTNGTSWAAMTGLASYEYKGVAYGDDRFVCVGDGASYYSTNGESWTAMTGASGNLFGVTYGNGRFVCVGANGVSYYSTNGESWSVMHGLASYAYKGVAYGNGRFVCVGGSGKSYYSTNGTNWYEITGLDTSYAYNGVTYGDDRFVCVGDGASYYSTNGTSWTAMTGLASYEYKGVAYGNGRFICVGASGKSYYSTNGTSWTAMTGLANATYNGVASNK